MSNSWTTQAGWEEEDKGCGQRDITTGASGDAVQCSTTHLLGVALAVVESDVPELEGGRAGPRRGHLDVRRVWVVVYARCDVLQHVAHVAHVDEGLQQLLSDFLALHPTVEVVVREQQLALFNQVRDSLSELSRSFEHLKYLK